jgi:hypothetical protein
MAHPQFFGDPVRLFRQAPRIERDDAERLARLGGQD